MQSDNYIVMPMMIFFTDDHNRIVLSPMDDSEHQGEFINACYIDVSIETGPPC